MKTIKRILIGLVLIFISCIVINSKTRFFKDIGENIPYLNKNYPHIAQTISDLSDKANELISHIPTPGEFIAKIRNTELPIDPDDVAENVYYASDTMLNFYSRRNISVSIADGKADIYGVSDNENDKYLVYRFLDKDGNMLHQESDLCDSDGEFRRIITIPDDAHQLTVFTGADRYGEFTGLVHNYVLLTKNDNDEWSLVTSPVYDGNVMLYEKSKSKSNALKSTYDVCHKEPEIKELAMSITKNINTDYEKALAIHNWVCTNIYYDSDSIDGVSNNAPYVASDVLEKRRAVCLGYSNLYAALCRSIGIPCNVVMGYALGVGTGDVSWNEINTHSTDANHAWNEVYIDNRWVIVDTTWDSKNKIVDGITYTDDNISHLYFDANLKFFSTNHKIIEYMR